MDYGGIPSAISVAIHAGDKVVGAVNLVWLAEKQTMAEVASAHLAQLTLTAQTIGNALNCPQDI